MSTIYIVKRMQIIDRDLTLQGVYKGAHYKLIENASPFFSSVASSRTPGLQKKRIAVCLRAVCTFNPLGFSVY